MARFACDSVVRDLSCSQKIYTLCKFFVNKKKIFRPAGGEMLCQVSDRVTRASDTIWFSLISILSAGAARSSMG